MTPGAEVGRHLLRHDHRHSYTVEGLSQITNLLPDGAASLTTFHAAPYTPCSHPSLRKES